MKAVRICSLLAGALSFAGPAGVAQRPGYGSGEEPPSSPAASSAQISFSYENAGLDPVRYLVTVNELGSGHYHSEPAPQTAIVSSMADMPSQPQDTRIQLTPQTRDLLFNVARSRKFFAMSCEDGKGKVAFQGKKTLAYHGVDGSGECIYNWSKDDRIERVTRTFEGISLTIEAGSRLAREHRHDPLALDHELDELMADFKDGRAVEIGNIAGELQSIAQDERVMDRARSRAAALLRTPSQSVN